MSRKDIERKIEEIFRFAELEKFRKMKLKNYSSGMYARLAFATAIATEPEILLIDEVLAVGDTSFQKKCIAKIKELKNDGTTMVVVSHSIDLLKEVCDKIYLLRDGRIYSESS
jgi:ABC-type polysaccharide/polyol phosphate transport system ATPase subunit